MLLTTIGLLASSTANAKPCPSVPACPSAVEVPPAVVTVERQEVPVAIADLEAVLKGAVAFQDPDARVDVRRTPTTVVAVLKWHPGDGFADCTLVYDQAGLASRACSGQYVSHSMGEANKRYAYTSQERFVDDKRVAATGNVRATLLTTGVHEDTAVTLSNAVETIDDGHFNAAPRVQRSLLLQALKQD